MRALYAAAILAGLALAPAAGASEVPESVCSPRTNVWVCASTALATCDEPAKTDARGWWVAFGVSPVGGLGAGAYQRCSEDDGTLRETTRVGAGGNPAQQGADLNAERRTTTGEDGASSSTCTVEGGRELSGQRRTASC